MELEELIRESARAVGVAPTVADLRAGARRRRDRRIRAAATVTLVAALAVVVPVLLSRRDAKESTVSVRPTPVGRTVSSWSPVASVGVAGEPIPTYAQLVAAGDRLFVVMAAGDQNRPGMEDANWVRVASVDPITGQTVDLGFRAALPQGPPLVQSVVGWRDGPVVAVAAGPAPFVSRWHSGSWEPVPLPDGVTLASANSLAVMGDDLVIVAAANDPTASDRLWATSDGESWRTLPSPPIGSGLYSGADGMLIRQRFTADQRPVPLTDALLPGHDTWTTAPTPPYPAYGIAAGDVVDGVIVSCGSQRGESVYECSRWNPRGGLRGTDPPPFPQGFFLERLGDRIQVVAVGDSRVLITTGYENVGSTDRNWALYEPEKDQWRVVPAPPLSAVRTASLVRVGDSVYSAAFTPVDSPSPIVITRLDIGNDDPVVPHTVAGQGFSVRLPNDRWRVTDEGDAVVVSAAATATDGAGKECPAERVEFREVPAGAVNDSSPGTNGVTAPTPPCEPWTSNLTVNGRYFEVTVFNSAPEHMNTTADLDVIIGSFRAAP